MIFAGGRLVLTFLHILLLWELGVWATVQRQLLATERQKRAVRYEGKEIMDSNPWVAALLFP